MDKSAYTEKVIAHRERMYRFALSITADRDDAMDAVQDVLERFWRRRGELAGFRNLESALLSATRNRCIDTLRRRRVRAAAPPLSEEVHQTEPGLNTQHIEAAIASLPDRQREAFHLRDVEGMEFPEIATVMGCDEAAVRVNLSRARHALREKLQFLRSE